MTPRAPLDGDQSLTLPVSAEKLVPHRPPILFVDRLTELTDDTAVVEARMTEENPLADERGRLDPLVTLELMAQAYAAVKGYRELLAGVTPGKGFLVGVRKFQVSEAPLAGDLLHVSVKTIASIAGFAVAEGTVTRAGSLIASATLKLWVPETTGEG